MRRCTINPDNISIYDDLRVGPVNIHRNTLNMRITLVRNEFSKRLCFEKHICKSSPEKIVEI